MKQFFVSILIILICGSVVYWLRSSSPEAAQGEPTLAPAVKVTTQTLERQNYQISLNAFGNVEPDQRFQLHALVGGQVVYKSEAFKAGSTVSKGQVLIEIDRGDYELALAQAKTQLASARLSLEEEEARAEQAARDWTKQKDRSAARDFVLRKPHLEAARANVESAKAVLADAERDLARTQVRAEFDGVIESVNINTGAVISPSTEIGVGFANQLGEVRLAIPVGETRFLSFEGDVEGAVEGDNKPAPAISIFNRLVEPIEEWQATYLRTEPTIDSQSQQVIVVVGLNAPFSQDRSHEKHALLAGQYVSAKITGATLNNVIVVPNEFVYQGSYVYVVENSESGAQQSIQSSVDSQSPNSVLRRADITLAHRGENESVVLSGLNDGDQLVTTVLGQLASGTRLEVLP